MIPRTMSMVRFSDDCLPEDHRGQYPMEKHRLYLFMGEIPNMPEHCAVVDQATGEWFVGYHTNLFTEQEQRDD